MTVENNHLRGILIFAIVVVVGLAFYLLRLIFRNLANCLPLPPPPAEEPKPKWNGPHLLSLVKEAYKGCSWHYEWNGPVDHPGVIILVWRSWIELDGKTARSLDVLLIKEDGSVETLGTCVECEVFGPPKKEK
jgi:hypothetical protein